MNQPDASEVRTNLVSVISPGVGEKSVLESRGHEALFLCLLKQLPLCEGNLCPFPLPYFHKDFKQFTYGLNLLPFLLQI